MSTLYVTDRNGTQCELEATIGISLMEILRNGGLPIEATCGGQGICSTCHVYIDSEFLNEIEPRNAEEQVIVEDTGYFEENSRLACQVDWEDKLDGLKLTLAPEF